MIKESGIQRDCKNCIYYMHDRRYKDAGLVDRCAYTDQYIRDALDKIDINAKYTFSMSVDTKSANKCDRYKETE